MHIFHCRTIIKLSSHSVYTVAKNPGVLNAADVQEVPCHTLCGLTDG